MTGAAIGGVIALLMVAMVGLIIGALAKCLIPSPDLGGWFVTILLDIAGSWVGHFVFGALRLQGLATSIIGAILGRDAAGVSLPGRQGQEVIGR